VNTNSSTLSEAEWDFRALDSKTPTPEQRLDLAAAIYYEYARESNSLRKLVREYSALPEPIRSAIESEDRPRALSSHTTEVSERLTNMDFIPFWRCILWPEYFPNTPWLAIRHSERLRRISFDTFAHFFIPLLSMCPLQLVAKDAAVVVGRRLGRGNTARLQLRAPAPSDATPRARKWISVDPTLDRVPGVGNFIVSINWRGGNDTDIAKKFAKMVRLHRPETLAEPLSDASPQKVNFAYLTRLGAIRLLHHLSPQQARAFCKAQWSPLPNWKDDALVKSETSKWRRRVEADYRKFFRSEFFEPPLNPPVPKRERPRCCTTASQAKRVRE
jgi:hypothetical protein